MYWNRNEEKIKTSEKFQLNNWNWRLHVCKYCFCIICRLQLHSIFFFSDFMNRRTKERQYATTATVNKINNQWTKCRQFMLALCRNSFFLYLSFSLSPIFVFLSSGAASRIGMPNGKNDRRFLVWKSTISCSCTSWQSILRNRIQTRHLIHALHTNWRPNERQTEKNNVSRIKIQFMLAKNERRSATLYKMQSSMCDASYQPLLLLMSPWQIWCMRRPKEMSNQPTTCTKPRMNIELRLFFS